MIMVRVLVIDDSALVRQLLSHMLSQAKDIMVVGCAEDPYKAREMIKVLQPDVLTLDVEMPKMDGLAFLRNLMRLRPMPVVMVSSLTERGADVTLEALSLGAVDFIAKPKQDLTNRLLDYQQELIDKVHLAAASHVTPQYGSSAPLSSDAKLKHRIIAIGASTGGTEAIQRVVAPLPENTPPIVIAQHIPATFSASFARRLNQHARMEVIEAQGGEKLTQGVAYLAPGHAHLVVERRGAHIYTRLLDTETVNRHKPSVDVLFNSIAEIAAKSAIGVILTGMGKDGAAGLLKMCQAGAHTIAQDEASSVVWGMPGSAVALNACNEQLPLANIPARLLQLLTTP
ncbi:chemotaxis response regulator protein-glutamate methylesterase of group 1 operon [Shewanella chilikensis]|nr:chemotaxis response regulator protein-glutamate methylesterase of group 1 operon [Shewanella chilikensis]